MQKYKKAVLKMADINGINFFKHNVISEVSVGKASLKKHIYSEERNVEF